MNLALTIHYFVLITQLYIPFLSQILSCPHCHIPLCCLATFSHRHWPSTIFSQPPRAEAAPMSRTERKGEGEEWEREREKVRDPKTTKTWPATFDRMLEKDSSESRGPRWPLPWRSPRRWLLAPKNGTAPLVGRPVEINLSGTPSFLRLA